MKILTCIFLLLPILSITAADNDDEKKATTPLGCDATNLSEYCVCPPLCADVGKCPCKFPGTNEIVNPRPYTYVPVPPFCSCPVARCAAKECPSNIEICTADNFLAVV